MSLTERICSTVGPLQKEEAAILSEVESEYSDHLHRPESRIKRRECRGSFLLELLKILADDPSRIIIFLPNLRLCSQFKATSLRIEKSVLIPGLQADETLCLDQCAIRHLDLSNGIFPSLYMRGAMIEGELILEKSRISGVLDLTAARIGSTLNLNGSVMTIDCAVEHAAENAGDTAQTDTSNARREQYDRIEMSSLLDARIGGSLRMNRARMDRKLRMTNAKIEGDVDLWGLEFQDVGDLENGLICSNCEIGEKLVLTQARCDGNTRIVLDYSRMRILQFGKDKSQWPAGGRISLEGTTFDALAFIERQKKGETLTVFDKDLTIALLKRNGPAFYRQPWRQAAHSMRQKGYAEEGLEIMVSMEKEAERVDAEQHRARLHKSGLTFFERILLTGRRIRRTLSTSLWWFADYGYRPEKTFWSLLVLLLVNIGANAAIMVWHQDALVPALEEVYLHEAADPWNGTPTEYPRFRPIVYALDTLVPALDLGQENAWQPNWNNTFGIIYGFYLYLGHMFFGLLLIGVLVAGITKRLTDDL